MNGTHVAIVSNFHNLKDVSDKDKKKQKFTQLRIFPRLSKSSVLQVVRPQCDSRKSAAALQTNLPLGHEGRRDYYGIPVEILYQLCGDPDER